MADWTAIRARAQGPQEDQHRWQQAKLIQEDKLCGTPTARSREEPHDGPIDHIPWKGPGKGFDKAPKKCEEVDQAAEADCTAVDLALRIPFDPTRRFAMPANFDPNPPAQASLPWLKLRNVPHRFSSKPL